MASRRFDRLMLSHSVMMKVEIRRLSDGQFRAFIGALCLASRSPERGFLIGSDGQPITSREIGDEAGVSDKVARAMVDRLVEAETLALDNDRLCWFFTNWDEFNPPRYQSEQPSEQARRKRESRERQKAAVAAAKKPVPVLDGDAEAFWRSKSDELMAVLYESAFRMWLEPLRGLKVSESELVLIGHASIVSWAERRYLGVLNDVFAPRRVILKPMED